MIAKRVWILGGAAGALFVLITVAAVMVLVTVRRPFPSATGVTTLSGIEAPVEIVRDDRGIPHIYAETTDDLYFGQGYAHAQDRFWQMEFARRIGAGRLSEFFGEPTLGIDEFMRTMGFTHLAREELRNMPERFRRALESYAAGVNAYTESRSPAELGLEFRLLELQGVTPTIEPWQPVHTLTWLKIMAYDLGGNMLQELNRLDLLGLVGRSKAADFFPEYRYGEMPVIVPDSHLSHPDRTRGDSESSDEIHTTAARPYLDAARAAVAAGFVGGADPTQPLLFGKGGGVGSNSWVIDGGLSSTEAPILAADLHLGVQMPSIWYEIVLHAGLDTHDSETSPEESSRAFGRTFSAAGFGFPGTPGIVLGHNRDIAWGLTNVNPDVQDLYIERINPENPTEYEVNGSWTPMDVRVEEIVVHGRDEPHRISVRRTRNGPIITDAHGPQDGRNAFGYAFPSTGAGRSDLPETDGEVQGEAADFSLPGAGLYLTEISLRWTAFEENRTFQSLMMINRARSFPEFRDAARYFDIPSQNLVYADRSGNIGYQMPGLIPIRRRGAGTLPVPGWVDDYQWEGFVPFGELPYMLNPESGYIVTANNAVTTPAYEHLITRDYNFGYRARRIEALIIDHDRPISPQAVALHQGDTYNRSAEEMLDYLDSVALGEEIEVGERAVAPERMEAALEVLDDWNRYMDADSAGAALFGLFFVSLLEETVYDEIPEQYRTRNRLLGRTSRIQEFFRKILPDPDNAWWDDVSTPARRESRDEVLTRSLARAILRGEEMLGEDLSEWEWGTLHTITFRNQTFGESGIGLLERVFNRGPFPVPSGLDQVFSADVDLSNPFEVVNHASMRQVIDLAELTDSLFTHTTGQSGHPFHSHYDDMIDDWLNVRFHEHHWTRPELLRSSPDILRLMPGR